MKTRKERSVRIFDSDDRSSAMLSAGLGGGGGRGRGSWSVEFAGNSARLDGELGSRRRKNAF